MFLYPGSVAKLYEAARAAGIKHILAIEWTGYSHELEQVFLFTEKPQESAVLRNGFYVHDYPNILKRSGYIPTVAAIQKLPMRKPFQQDAHLATILGRIQR